MANQWLNRPNLRYNYTINIVEASFWGFGFGLASINAFLPLFLLQFTDSAVLIGLVPAILNIGFQVPQLFMAKKVASQHHIKPLVMKTTIHERLPYLALAVVALFSPRLGATLTIVLVYGCLAWLGLGGGFTGNSWQILICKLIPSDYRSMFFSIQGAGVNFLSSLGAILAGTVLERQPGGIGYFATFIFAFLSMMVSYVLLNTAREEQAEEVLDLQTSPSIIKMAMRILKDDDNFRWYLISRLFLPFGTMSAAFYVMYLSTAFQADEGTVGVLASVQFVSTVVFGLLLGWLSDHVGRRFAMILSLAIILLSPILALLAKSISMFYIIFALGGIINGAFWSVFLSFTLEFGETLDRPAYVGMINTLTAPSSLIAQLAGGWIADTHGFSITFLLAAIFALVTLVLVFLFVKDPRKASPKLLPSS